MQQRAHGTNVQLIVVDDKDLTLLIRVSNLTDIPQERLRLKDYHLIRGRGVVVLDLRVVKADPRMITTIDP